MADFDATLPMARTGIHTLWEPGWSRGWFQLPSEGARLCLNPAESTLYRLFLGHPEGLVADDLVLHWNELWSIYAHESCFEMSDSGKVETPKTRHRQRGTYMPDYQ